MSVATHGHVPSGSKELGSARRGSCLQASCQKEVVLSSPNSATPDRVATVPSTLSSGGRPHPLQSDQVNMSLDLVHL
jgi:hypothetical protein